MIKFVKACRVCQAIRKDETLARRIYQSKQYIKGGEPLTAIAEDHPDLFTYQGLYNHAIKHQALSEKELTDKRLENVAKETSAKIARTRVRHEDLRQAVLDKAMELLEGGELRGITATSALKAADKMSDIEQREANRQMMFMAMINKFASAEIIRVEGEEGFQLGEPDSTTVASDSPF